MNRYVKTKGAENWRLYWDDPKNEPSTNFMDRQLRSAWDNLMNDSKAIQLEAQSRLRFVANAGVMKQIGKPIFKYSDQCKDGRAIGINEMGGWCFIKPEDIEAIVYSDKPPMDKEYSVFICENDREAPADWVDKMRQYGDPYTISFFGSRPEAEIKSLLQDASFITFTTTFLSFQWFITLLAAAPKNAKIIGRCADNDLWEAAKDLASAYNYTLIRVC